MRWLAAGWLAGLVALAVPLLIHLWSRRPSAVVPLPTLRWLQDVPAARRLSRRIEEPLLLALRAGALAALVIGLAGPVLDARGTGERSLVVHEPWRASLPAAERAAAVPLPVGADAWALLAALDAQRPAGGPFEVLAPRHTALVDGERPAIGRAVTWRTLPADATVAPAVAAARLVPDTASLTVAERRRLGLALAIAGSVSEADGAATRSLAIGEAADPALTPLMHDADGAPLLAADLRTSPARLVLARPALGTEPSAPAAALPEALLAARLGGVEPRSTASEAQLLPARAAARTAAVADGEAVRARALLPWWLLAALLLAAERALSLRRTP